MDMNAFGPARAEVALRLAPAEGSTGAAAEGWAVRRAGRWSWLCAAPQPPGRRLTLSFSLPGFRLAPDGSLRPAGPEDSAAIALLAEVRACRFWPPRSAFVLRLSLWGRIWPDDFTG